MRGSDTVAGTNQLDSTVGIARLVTALLTPCHEDGAVDLDAIGPLVEHQVEQGTDGLFVLGTAGQGPLLETTERLAVLERIVAASAGRLAVICHVGAASTETAVRLARHAQACGVAAVASVPPTYYSPDRRTVAEFYLTLIDAVDLPVYAYDNPKATGYSFSVEELASLTTAGLAGVKVARSEIVCFQDLLSAGVACWVADAHLNAAALFAGASGSISTITNVAPRLFRELQAAVRSCDIEHARQLQRRIDRFARGVRKPIIGGLHYACTRLGLPAGAPRRPLRLPEDEERTVIDGALKGEGLV